VSHQRPDSTSSFARSRTVFLRLLGLVYLIAFASLGVQILGLVGEHGILPVAQFLPQVHRAYGADAYRIYPTLLWVSASDASLLFLCWGGALMSIMLIAGIAQLSVLVALWTFYLSLTVAGQLFLQFQWDALLLETGLLACLYAPWRGTEPAPIVRWVVGTLPFKLTFLSGATKILSGDPSWANWTAMTYHYQTQPIPAWTSWFAYHLPFPFHYWSVPGMLGIELVATFALLLPARFRRTRLFACLAMIFLQLGIGLTGNYGFFNLLSIVLYLAALDDQTLRHFRLPRREVNVLPRRSEAPAWRLTASVVAVIFATMSLATCIREMEVTARGAASVDRTWAGSALRLASPFRAVNGYGLFRVMTTSRPEIVIEVSSDGQDWKEYEFRWKPGDPARRPSFVEPHMPRLDWQMWFAALAPGAAQYWLDRLLQRIVAGEPAVLQLLGPAPLRDRPRFARLAHWDYRFTTSIERAATDAWWNRTFLAYLTESVPLRQ
jgi:lipase maturation factor 1